MLELISNHSSMFLTPTYPARTGGGHGCRARSDGTDADAEPCQFVPLPVQPGRLVCADYLLHASLLFHLEPRRRLAVAA